MLQAARTVARNLSTSSLRRLLSLDSDWAEDRTCADADPVSVAPLLTSVMLDAVWLVPSAACCTLRAISLVAAPCSSIAAAIAAVTCEILSIVVPISLIALTELPVATLNLGDLAADLARRLRCLRGQRLHFGSHHRKASPGVAGARGLDGGVQRQKVGLRRDAVDQLDDVADLRGRHRQLVDALVGLLGLQHGGLRDLGRGLDLAADFTDR